MTWLRCVPVFAVLVAACNDPDLVDPPPVNAKIAREVGQGSLPFEVRCDGPEDELALLGDLCGESTEQLFWTRVEVRRGNGMATQVGVPGPSLLLFGQVERRPEYDENVAGELAYAAYVVLDAEDLDGLAPDLEQWRDGEAVTSGHVRTERAFFVACDGDAWAAEGSFVWRSTTIELRWHAANAC